MYREEICIYRSSNKGETSSLKDVNSNKNGSGESPTSVNGKEECTVVEHEVGLFRNGSMKTTCCFFSTVSFPRVVQVACLLTKVRRVAMECRGCMLLRAGYTGFSPLLL
jgi:hypothetical protein